MAEAGRADLGVESREFERSLPQRGRRWVAGGGFVTAERDCGVVRADETEEKERMT